jgi:hypothetical protein
MTDPGSPLPVYKRQNDNDYADIKLKTKIKQKFEKFIASLFNKHSNN